MNAAVVGVSALFIFVIAYRFYATYLSRHLFALEESDRHQRPTPAQEFNDGIDFVPTSKNILMGHHFSSIAGAAPIVGPAVAAIWGWLPALLWIVFGVIFMGACHDMGALVLSMRHRGQSLVGVAGEVLGGQARALFMIVIFFLIWMVIAVFALVIANLFIQFPAAVIPVNFEIIIAVLMGLFINKKGKSLTIPSLLAQLTLMIMIVVGSFYPVSLKAMVGEHELMVWICFLLIYSFVASVLPVWTLLQPRDYINSHQLIVGLGLMIVGLVIVSPTIVAPAINPEPVGAPPWFPFLFITIACGAISGFHGLVGSGTTSKQVKSFQDAKPVAYGSMLLESTLAVLATLAVTAGFKTTTLWHAHYSSWNQANGLAQKISAFVLGAGSFVAGVGIPEHISHTVIAVLIISFAATSLDTACRIQRYVIGEIGDFVHVPVLKNRYLASFLAVGTAFLLMIAGQGGKGGLMLWPLFGATNQMLAFLTMILISVYLIRKGKRTKIYLVPTCFLGVVTTIGLVVNIQTYVQQSNTYLMILGSVLLLVQLWIMALGLNAYRKEN